jgi:hypothetical protein
LSSKDENSTHQNRTQNQTVNNEATTTNSSKSKRSQKPQKNHTEKQEIKSETHLTAIGVCTTIRPENSGI